ncbi:hypothetical protein HBH47_113620 [Parastagonospora nodorum]|nr:hypothetical protein HBH47_113620 [Parastagonospora nodorum]
MGSPEAIRKSFPIAQVEITIAKTSSLIAPASNLTKAEFAIYKPTTRSYLPLTANSAKGITRVVESWTEGIMHHDRSIRHVQCRKRTNLPY